MTFRTIIFGAAPVAALLLGACAAAAQAYDPMRPAPNPLAPTVAAPAAGPAVETDPDLGDLPVGPGAEDTYFQCVACHSTAIIRQQRLTDERWDYLWTWMVEEQGMYEPDPEVEETIKAYLKTHFSSER
jgi:hypothetical protein